MKTTNATESSSVRLPDGFTPESLSGSAWGYARPVVAEAVDLSGPGSVTRAKQLASRLCRFLAVSGWDRATTPDLTVLLRAERIDVLVVPDIVCIAHITNTMATSGDDFEKGDANGVHAALTLTGHLAQVLGRS